jgi:hypothetical protein
MPSRIRNKIIFLTCLLFFVAGGFLVYRYWVMQKPFAVILFISENFSSSTLSAARLFAGGADYRFGMESLPHTLSTHTAAGNGTTSVTFGGGNSLRIGRVEHPRFTNDGLRASQLLDIFAVGPKVGTNVVNRVAGRININTASTNTLRALAAGVRHALEPSIRPANLDVPLAAVSAFVSGVTNFRSQRPFYSTSQLNLLSTNPAGAANWVNGAVFGNTNLLGATAWGDQAAEEWFSRIYHLSTVRSRNFLVHVVGQSVLTNNPTTVLSSSRQVFQIYAQPVRGTDGLTTNTRVQTLRQWEL